MYYDQSLFDIRFEWGEQGLVHTTPGACVIIVDVLSFSTSVDIIVGNRAIVYPWRYRDTSVQDFAREQNAEVASHIRSSGEYSLSPSSLLSIPARTKIVLPSPNGSTLAHHAKGEYILAACLRNYAAVAAFVERCASSVTVIAAGERWNDSSIRFALEDMIGAGAVIGALSGTRSPEAQAAADIFRSVSTSLLPTLQQCSSGRELIERGFPDDVTLAVQAGCSTAVPRLLNGAFINAAEHN